MTSHGLCCLTGPLITRMRCLRNSASDLRSFHLLPWLDTHVSSTTNKAVFSMRQPGVTQSHLLDAIAAWKCTARPLEECIAKSRHKTYPPRRQDASATGIEGLSRFAQTHTWASSVDVTRLRACFWIKPAQTSARLQTSSSTKRQAPRIAWTTRWWESFPSKALTRASLFARSIWFLKFWFLTWFARACNGSLISSCSKLPSNKAWALSSNSLSWLNSYSFWWSSLQPLVGRCLLTRSKLQATPWRASSNARRRRLRKAASDVACQDLTEPHQTTPLCTCQFGLEHFRHRMFLVKHCILQITLLCNSKIQATFSLTAQPWWPEVLTPDGLSLLQDLLRLLAICCPCVTCTQFQFIQLKSNGAWPPLAPNDAILFGKKLFDSTCGTTLQGAVDLKCTS